MHPHWRKHPPRRMRSREPANREQSVQSDRSGQFRRNACVDIGINAAHRGGRTRAKTSYPPMNPSEADRLHRLHGGAFPSAPLLKPDGASFTVDSASLGWVAVYFYPGTHTTPVSGYDSPAEDAAQHRAFQANHLALRALGADVVGISSQSKREQHQTLIEHRISHRMLTDPELTLAEMLSLPVFEHDGRWWYQRLTLLAKEQVEPRSLGCSEPVRLLVIEHVFYPTLSAANAPAQVMTWLRLHA